MGLLDSYTGVGMSTRPALHQDVLAALVANLYFEYIDDYIVRSKSCIDPADLNSQAPDIVLLEREPCSIFNRNNHH